MNLLARGYMTELSLSESKSLIECKYCKSQNIIETIMPSGYTHYSRLDCSDCKRMAWGRKPENISKRKDDNQEWRKIHKKNGYFCQICTVDNLLLPLDSSWHCDHIIELQDGGEDGFANTQMLCMSCHSFKNSQRWKISAIRKLQLLK